MNDNPDQAELRRVLADFGYGNLVAALDGLNHYVAKNGPLDDAIYMRRRVMDRLNPTDLKPPAILWQPRTRGLWEQDWLETILPKLPDLGDQVSADEMKNRVLFVVDNRINSSKLAFYKKAYADGCRIILMHLSDEAYEDDYNTYRFCYRVFRNYYSPIFDEVKKIKFFALGFKAGFNRENHGLLHLRRSIDRKFVWSFAGDPAKSTRPEMLTSMRNIAGGFEHLTSGFNSADALDTSSYAHIMTESIFVPCPVGWSNLDSFRVYEALEAGCIPLVERRPGFNYFAEAYGPVPFPSLYSWVEAPTLIEHLRRHALVEQLQQSCHLWWTSYKRKLRKTLASTLEDAASI